MDMTDPPGGRGGRGSVVPYMRLGYVPATAGGSVSLTLEYAQDDFALGNLAGALGQQADADALAARRLGYRKLYDPASGFLRGRLDNGSFASTVFDPVDSTDDYVEADAWQSLWVAHDVDGMATLFGGKKGLTDKLEMMFELSKMEWESIDPHDMATRVAPRPYYWAGNEPDIHAAWMFAQAGRADLAQRWLRWIMDTFYGTGVDGLPGNDDGGTMSAWYLFAALGFYPLVGSDRYVVGAPRFPHAEIAVAGGTFTIDAPGVSDANPYVQSVMLNGAPLAAPELRHADLRAGGSLVFTMGPAPSSWGVSQ
jgi:predicted alpha-1,2-mannosidase